ncbi:YcjF family protein [Nodosilinea sp. E11]|uniref:YcjF family protein n=1 Tax=Nodosilinea sp. E11 TaxID=3037479 RepID=UPI002934170B|nr:GTPase [Nodosilinea sp. E11]WOD37727.1 GTPase [Nodosilinea sp. E11]
MGDSKPANSPDQPSAKASFLTGVWQQMRDRTRKLRPAEQLNRWFNVDDDKVATILAAVREQLPTTEALLIGKPQAGKSSIVRGLTGVSADIIGQGFKPHTQHTQRYAYPSEDLPLLIFTDTVGLGDVTQATDDIIAELVNDLSASTSPGRILILTVKINDFATDTLRQIALRLRQQFPTIPCLLVVTSSHEVYPPSLDNHLPYPPTDESVDRPFAAVQANFEGLADRSVLIDFTLEEDGFDPVFYGLEALRDALADLLPEAEAQALYQLLDEQAEATEQLGNLYRDVGRHYISAFAVMAATLAAVPLPFATMPVLTSLQVSMVVLLGKLYGQTLSPSQAGGLISAIAGGFFAQAVGRELVKFIPGFGSVIAASWAAAYTWGLGEGACVYFGDLMGGKKPDPQKIQSAMQDAFTAAKERFTGSAGAPNPPPETF